MSTSIKWVIGIVVAVGLSAVAAVALAIGLFVPVQQVTSSQPDPVVTEEPVQVDVLDDGTWFAFVTVDGETGPTMLTIDPATILVGDEATAAAVEAGVITEGEDVPNDYFIANPESAVWRMPVTADTVIRVLSGLDLSQYLTIDGVTLEALANGSYDGPPVYGVMAGEPIAVNVTVAGGAVTLVEAVYFP